MARKHQVRPRAIIGGNNRSETRIRVGKRWLTLGKALEAARTIVAKEAEESRLASKQFLNDIVNGS